MGNLEFMNNLLLKKEQICERDTKQLNCICESLKTFVYFYNGLIINILKKYTQVGRVENFLIFMS
jgi:hypothetical protein